MQKSLADIWTWFAGNILRAFDHYTNCILIQVNLTGPPPSNTLSWPCDHCMFNIITVFLLTILVSFHFRSSIVILNFLRPDVFLFSPPLEVWRHGTARHDFLLVGRCVENSLYNDMYAVIMRSVTTSFFFLFSAWFSGQWCEKTEITHLNAMIGLVWFLCFNVISTFMGYLMPKPSF